MRDAAELSFEAPEDLDAEGTPREPARPTVCVIPARGMIDRAAADHIAFLVNRQTPCRAVVATRSAGLTAIADLHAMKEYENVDTLIVTTVGGVDSQQLRLIARRAVRDFPNANHFVMSLDEPVDAEREETRKAEGNSPVHTSIGPIIAALDCAPRRRESVMTQAEPILREDEPRVARSA
jgi:hypothetical protein